MERRRQEQLIAEIIRGLGTSLRNRRLYPPSHPNVRSPVERCVEDLAVLFADRAEIVLVITDGTLVFEGVPIFSLTSSLEHFMERLQAVGAPAVIFEKGVSAPEMEQFVYFLHETRETDLSAERIQDRLAELGIRRIRVRPPEPEDQEDEWALAREIYDNAVGVVAAVLQDVREGRIPSGTGADRVVIDMNSMLKRNRDALMALTLIKNYDEYTYNHSVNVSVIALALSERMHLSEEEKLEVGVAGLLHDVGKTQLAIDLIRKPGSLTVEEFEEIKKHPEEGFVLLGKMDHIRPGSAYLVREHHYRFDRTGYPPLPPEYEIQRHSHIIPVADCYDALTTMRSYQNAKTPQQALEIMRKLAGKSLSPRMMEAMSAMMGDLPIGTLVRLDTMEVGIVTALTPDGRMPGKVTLLMDGRGNRLAPPEPVDLSERNLRTGRFRRTVVGTVNPGLFPAPSPGGFLGVPSP